MSSCNNCWLEYFRVVLYRFVGTHFWMCLVMIVSKHFWIFSRYVRKTRIPMSSNRRTIPPPQAAPSPCEYVNIPAHSGSMAWPGCLPGGVILQHLICWQCKTSKRKRGWSNMYSSNSTLTWAGLQSLKKFNDFFSQKISTNLVISKILSKSQKKQQKLYKVQKRQAWTQNISKSLEMSQKCKNPCKPDNRHIFFTKSCAN